MASPQLENGFTRIANEIMDALGGIRIPGEARQVLDVIFRKTYGFQKKEDIIALSQFSLITKMSKTRIIQAIKKLGTLNLIITKKGNGLGNSYRFNKDFSTWKPLPKKVAITKKGNDDYQKRKLSLPKTGHTKEKKENTTKERENEGFKLFWESYPRKVAKVVALKSWLKIFPSKAYLPPNSPPPSPFPEIMAALEVHKKLDQWKKEDGRYIPHPATWLNKERWKDEIKIKENRFK